MTRGRRVSVWVALAGLTVVCLMPFVWFGLGRLWRALTLQLVGPADISDFLVLYAAGYLARFAPVALYDTPTFLAYGDLIPGLRQGHDGFLYPPFVAPPLELLTLVPYGVAFALATLVSLGCYALAAWLIAPRWFGPHSWLIWLVWLPFFLPAQYGLLIGQSEMLTAAAFAVFAWSTLRARNWSDNAVLGLVVWAIKPNLVPAFVVALASARRWRSLAIACIILAVATGVSVALLGLQSLTGFVDVNLARFDMARANTANLTEGITLYMSARSLLGPGAFTDVLTLVSSLAVWLAVAVLWWPGPRDDELRYLQVAALPVAACLTGIHAGSYELVSWLVAAWLLLRFAALRPRHRPLLGALFLALWWAGALSVVMTDPIADVVTVGVGVALLSACLYLNRPVHALRPVGAGPG